MRSHESGRMINPFFQPAAPVDDAYTALFKEGQTVLLQMELLNRKIACKSEADEKGKEAIFYPNPYSPVIQVLDKPLAEYEAELAQLVVHKDKIKEKLSMMLNTMDHHAASAGRLSF